MVSCRSDRPARGIDWLGSLLHSREDFISTIRLINIGYPYKYLKLIVSISTVLYKYNTSQTSFSGILLIPISELGTANTIVSDNDPLENKYAFLYLRRL